MRYWFPQYHEAKSRFLTFTVVAKILMQAGHEVVAEPDGCDAALFSMCDATEYRDLMRMRERTSLPLIVGGAYAFNFWSAKHFCDMVWVGEAFDMADCQTLKELAESPHCYTGGDTLPVASQRIDWERVPVAQIAPKKAYYWGGVGCKNACRFCFTSHTHRHQVNSDARIQKARAICKKKGVHLMIASNEYDNDPGASTFDMLLRDYVNTPVRANVVRCGVEFATDETRKRCGKPVTRNDIFHAIQKASKEGVSLRLFHIAGYDTVEEWDRYIEDIGEMLERANYNRLLDLGFNNLQYQNFTPLYAERRAIDPTRYIDHHKTREWYDRLRCHTKSVMVGAPSPFQHVCCRMGVELAQTKEQATYRARMMTNAKKKMTVQQAYDKLMATNVLDCPAYRVKRQTGEIVHMPVWD